MTQKQKERLFFCLVMLKGIANPDIQYKPSAEILDILENEIGSTMQTFWQLVDENEKLKNHIKDIY